MKFDLVSEGGSVKICALAGAYEGLVSRGFEPSHCAGTSSGAIIASVIAAGYNPEECKKIVFDTDFRKFLDGPSTMLGKTWNLFLHNGVYKGDYFFNFIRDLLAAKGIKTFRDLRTDETEINYQYRLRAFASDITSGKLISFPEDASLYGINPDDMEVALAVRASMSIPFLFRPVIIDPVTPNKEDTVSTTIVKMPTTETKHALVDGGLLSNFPIWTWDSDGEPIHPTFGMLLQESDHDVPKKTTNPFNLTLAIFSSMLKAHDKRFIRADDFTHRTINIPVGDVSALEFDLSVERKAWLYNEGRLAAEAFLNNWSWPKYKKWAVGSRNREE